MECSMEIFRNIPSPLGRPGEVFIHYYNNIVLMRIFKNTVSIPFRFEKMNIKIKKIMYNEYATKKVPGLNEGFLQYFQLSFLNRQQVDNTTYFVGNCKLGPLTHL